MNKRIKQMAKKRKVQVKKSKKVMILKTTFKNSASKKIDQELTQFKLEKIVKTPFMFNSVALYLNKMKKG